MQYINSDKAYTYIYCMDDGTREQIRLTPERGEFDNNI